MDRRLDFDKIESPDWAVTEKPEIICDGGGLQYRFDGRDGQFKLGSDALGGSLLMRPFNWRWDSGERWGRKSQSWLDIAFVNTEKIVSVLSLNKQSAINVYGALSRMLGAGKVAIAHRLLLSAEETEVTVVDEGGEYQDTFQVLHVTDCQPVTEEEFKQLRDFVTDVCFVWHITGEVD